MGLDLVGLAGGCLFGVVGLGALRYGKTEGKPVPMLLGAALMVYPYFLPDGLSVWLVGAGLSGCLFLSRE